MTTATSRPWRPSPAHFRAVTVGSIGLIAAVLFRVPQLLVLAAPFAMVAMWASATRPEQQPEVSGRLTQRTVREGEAVAWVGALTRLDGVDHALALAPGRPWLETRPRSGAAAAEVGFGTTAAEISIPMRATHWGHHEVGPVNVVAVSSWGAFRSRALDAGHQLSTLPLPDVFDAAPSPIRADGLVGVNRSVNPGDGGEFAGLRSFRTGDRLRRINWRRSLRSNELVVTATYAEQDTHVSLLVDAVDDLGISGGIDGTASSLDTTVRAAGAIAEYFLVRGDRVSLDVLGSRRLPRVPPAGGAKHLRRILDVLTSVEPEQFRPAALRAASTPVPHGALVVMLSPLVSPRALDRVAAVASHGVNVAVVDTLPDDVHLDGDAATELAWRIRLLERRAEVRSVQQLGVPVISWQGPGSLDPFLRSVARRAAAPRMARR